MLRIDEGPVGIVQGFVVGVGFFYVIDQMMPNNPMLNAPNPGEVATAKGARRMKGGPKIKAPKPMAGGRMVRM